jgi:hypothetical protein
MLIVIHPPGYEPERRYAYEVLLEDFLGLQVEYRTEERSDVRIVSALDDAKELRVADRLFATAPECWLTSASLPVRPLARADLAAWQDEATLVSPEVPVLYGDPLADRDGGDDGYWREEEGRAEWGIDWFGGAFFLLTRYEEQVLGERDVRERFPARAALAWQEGFLDRPLVNEYLEVLWASLRRLWPGLVRKPRVFQARLSHDVDWPYYAAGRPWRTVCKNALGDLVKRRDVNKAWQRLSVYLRALGGRESDDPFDTFDEIMARSEELGLTSAFYFIADQTGGAIDGDYSLDDPRLRRLLRRIHERGHEIGLHPSYETFRDGTQLKKEFATLLNACAAEGIAQAEWGGRQHFLRWEAGETWRLWEDAGLAYDSTVGFAEQPGFRTGACYEHPVFLLRERKRLKLRERPLVVMDQTLLHAQYLNLSPERAQELAEQLLDRCRMYGGEFTLLWHNSQLMEAGERGLYRQLTGTLT